MQPNDKEVDWTKKIDNATICRYFYVHFFLIIAVSIYVIYADIRLCMAYPPGLKWVPFANLPALLLATLNSLFLYILCSRTLLK